MTHAPLRLLLVFCLGTVVPATGLAQTLAAGSVPALGASVPARLVPPTVAAVRVQAGPTLDGRIDDAAWSGVPIINTFTQRDPDEGQPSSEPTEVRVVYTNEAIYIAARLTDRAGVTSRLGRRDMNMASSDWFRVSFDSYYDRRIGYRFDVNPAGVRRDAALGAAAVVVAGAAVAAASGVAMATWRGMPCGAPRRRLTRTAGRLKCASRSVSCASCPPRS